MQMLTAALTAAVLGSPPPPGLTQHRQPTWTCLATTYCPHGPGERGRIMVRGRYRWADPPGGGPTAAFTRQVLQRWHIATDPDVIPMGTKCYIGDPYNEIVLATDTGGAIIGNHIDVCRPDAREFWEHRNDCATVRIWRLGHLTRAQAAAWRPSR